MSELASVNPSYDIAGIYEKVDLKSGAKVLDSYGNVKDAKAVCVPTKIDTGKYEVEVLCQYGIAAFTMRSAV